MTKAILTGASVGIGAAAAKLFLDRGFEVFNLSRRPCPVNGVRNIPCDLADNDSINAALVQLLAELPSSEEICLLHNACQMRKDSALDCASDSLSEVMQTNLVAANTLNQALLPHMASGSSILYIGSTLSEKAVGGSFSYVISKHALLGMMRATCQDLMGTGIHTACICPGFTDTEMLRTHIGDNPDVVSSISSLNSFSRLIEPEEIAELISWAQANPVINGAVLHANLGQKES